MKHLSPERIIDIAEGAPMRSAEARHCAACLVCSREVQETTRLLATIRSSSDSEPDASRMEALTARIDIRIAHMDRPRTRGPSGRFRWGYLALPLAAAVSLVIIPRSRDSSAYVLPMIQEQGYQSDLTAEEFHAVVYSLASPMEELGVAASVLDQHTSPAEALDALSSDELERLLELMPDYDRG